MNFIHSDFYSFIKDIVTVLLTIWGLVIASGGLTTWKNQTEYKLGHDLINSVIKLRESIKFVRNPWVGAGEIENAKNEYIKKHPGLTQEQIDKNINAYVYDLRWKRISDAYTEMESNLIEAEILWGKEILTKIKPLKDSVKELNLGLYKYFNPDLRIDPDIYDLVYNSGSEGNPDKFETKIDDQIEVVKKYLTSKME